MNYNLAANNGAHSLHGGTKGWDRRVWKSEVVEQGVVFSRLSSDGEEVGQLCEKRKSAMTKATQPGLPRGSGSECDVHPGRVNLAHLDEGDGEHGDAVEHGAPLLLQPGWTSGWQSSLVQPHH